MQVTSKVLLEPSAEPVTVEEVKAQAYITADNRDTVIESLIKVARKRCERYAGVSFMIQTRVVKLDYFPYCKTEIIELPMGPVLAISGSDTGNPANTLGISYTDEDGGTQTLVLNTDFYLDSHSEIPRLLPVDSWPSDFDDERLNPITITYTAGYSSAETVPSEAKQAIIFQVIYMHENPEGSGNDLCDAAQGLLDSIKVYYNASQD
jgi:uncharacterized phiE125 gp8 family phage protein